MRKPAISIKLSPTNYGGLVALANRIIVSITGNLNFVTPAPTLANLQAATTDVEDAIARWGPRGSRGTQDDLVDLRHKARILADMLKAEAQYVMLTAQIAASTDYGAMGTIISTSGFQLSNVQNPQGILQMVQNFRQFASRQLNRNEVKLRWKKPLNVTSQNNVKNYKVLRSMSTDFTTAVEVAIVTKGTFTDTNATTSVVVWTYRVIPYNMDGPGVLSNPITVAVLGV